MTVKWIFDVDGTLTPARVKMDVSFALWFAEFCERQDVYIVTGGDRSQTIKQIGEYIYHKCKRVYQCSGNDVWERDLNIRKNTIDITEELSDFFKEWLDKSEFDGKIGDHVEIRNGVINFSILGRTTATNLRARAKYIVWDGETSERIRLHKEFNEKFNRLGYEANIAGDTGIDVTRMGDGKEQIIQDFTARDRLFFFGDKLEEGGNDHVLGTIIPDSYNVSGWKETWKILREIENL